MALPGNVAPNDLIQSTWGNSVVTNLTRVSPLTSYTVVTSNAAGDIFGGGNTYAWGTFTPQTTGPYLLSGWCYVSVNNPLVNVTLMIQVNGTNGPSNGCTLRVAGDAQSVPLAGVFNLTAGAVATITITGSITGTGGPAVIGGRFLTAIRVQVPTV